MMLSEILEKLNSIFKEQGDIDISMTTYFIDRKEFFIPLTSGTYHLIGMTKDKEARGES